MIDTKSPMQELRDKLQTVVEELKDAVPGTDQHGYKIAMQNVINDIDAQMAAKESELIREVAGATWDAAIDKHKYGAGYPNKETYINSLINTTTNG